MFVNTGIDNVYGYIKKDGTISYRIRKSDPRTGKSQIRTVVPPEGYRSGRKLTSYLTDERNRFFKELEAGLNPCTARSTFEDYFFGPYKKSFMGRDKTWHDYEATVRRHVIDWLGKVKMGEINSQTMIAFTDYLKNKGIGKPTYNSVIRILKAVFNCAIQDGVMLKNPLHGRVGKAMSVESDTKALTPDELSGLVVALTEETLFWRTLYMFLIVTGCRRSEAIALRWEDLDLESENPCANIKHSAEYVPRRPLMMVETKTHKSKRTVYLPQAVVSLLEEMRAQCDVGFVFCGREGSENMMHPDSVNTHTDRMCERMGLDHFTPHVLRRTLATTLAVRERVDPKTLQTILGHADIRTVLRYYVLPDIEAKKQAINAYVGYLPDTK